MRTFNLLGLAILAGGFAVVGCSTASEDCNLNASCEGDPSGTGAGSSVGGSGGSGAGGSGGGGVDPGCIPSEAGDAVDDTCGVFVSSSLGDDDSGDGTKDAPYATIAVAAATGNHVYACAETFDETEGVALAGGQSMFGGLDCADAWKHGETKTALNGPADTIALVISGDGSGRVEDLAITAANAVEAGGSSIAVLVNGSTAEFARCDLTAGDGADGANGEELDPDSALNGAPGGDGSWVVGEICTSAATQYAGGAAGEKTCGGVDASGGTGGQGTNTTVGEPGFDGQPDTEPGGKGGDGQSAMQCQSGGQGDQGPEGMPGPSGASLGTLTASGYAGADGTEGAEGGPGQGGGGGGAARECQATSDFAGPSGGGGGSGGCGGAAASAPRAGGSSFALASVNATVSISESALTSGAAGNGGDGAAGQDGGFGGGDGEAGGNGACDGGQGGSGGKGGPSGGAAGGHSAAVAHTGTLPEGGTLNSGTSGSGGTGGDNLTGTVADNGGDGQACLSLDFDNETCEV